jgi:hypothetical protein
MQQQSLFACETCTSLQAKNTALKKRVKTLERYAQKINAELKHVTDIKLGDSDHPLYAAYQYTCKQLEELRAQRYRDIMELLRPDLAEGGTLTDQTLKRLLVLAHPDRWSAGQPATELAHEMTVLINGLRASS